MSNERATARLQARIASLDPQACLLIDVENLRGLSGFRVSHGTVIAALACWTREWELTGRVVLAVDHGDEQCGFYNTQLGLAFVFAGPRQKADDVLVRLVSRGREEALVVTADHGQVHVDDRLVDLPPEVTSLVDGQSGEARFRWLHARPGAGTDLRVACGEAFGDLAWVAGVDRVVADGWLGPMVTDVSRRRLGDVALVPREPVAFVDAAEHTSIHLIGRHGGLTDAELDVPAIAALS